MESLSAVPSSAHGALAVAADDSLGARTVLAVVCVSIVAYALVIWRSPSFKDPRVTLSRQRNASDLHALVCVVGVSCWVARHGSVGMLTDPNILLHDRIQGLHWLQVGGRRARGTARRRVSPFLMGAFFERASICPRVALVWSRTGATQRRSTQLHWLSVETALRIDCAEPGCHGWWRVHSRHQYQQVTYGGGGVQLVQAQSLGYFLADTAADLLAPASFSWAFFLHHVLTGAHMTISGFRLGGTVISALFLLIEVSTPLNNLRWRLRASKGSALERAVATAFAVTFFVARLSCFVPVSSFTWLLVTATEAPPVVLWFTLPIDWGVSAFSVYWMAQVVVYMKKKSPTPAAAAAAAKEA